MEKVKQVWTWAKAHPQTSIYCDSGSSRCYLFSSKLGAL